jgi:hypothetical protein
MKKIIVVLCLGLMFGCQSVVPSGAYVQADRATRKAVEPMLDVTSKDHPELKDSITDLMASWESRLSSAEKSVAK